MISGFLVTSLLVVGSVFMAIAALGLLRFPDLFCRMHASTKASSFAMGCLLLAGILHFASFAIAVKLIAILLFIFLTAPVGAHILARAGYVSEVPLAKSTQRDDLGPYYQRLLREKSETATPGTGS